MNPFMSGIFFGWFIYRVNCGKPPTFRYITIRLYWALAVCVFMGTIFMTYKRDLMPIWCALMMSVGKFVFGLYIGSIVLMCHLGYGSNYKKTIKQCFNQFKKITMFHRPTDKAVHLQVHSTSQQIDVQHVHGQSISGHRHQRHQTSQRPFRRSDNGKCLPNTL